MSVSRLALALSLLLPALSLLAQKKPAPAPKSPILITADLTDAPRRLFHAEIDIPVAPGIVDLTTPEWIPGNHRPTGPVDDITGVVFTANGPGAATQTLTWRRDDQDLYLFHVTVPAGVTTLHAHLDCIVTSRITQKMAVLEWEKLLLYPAHTPVKDIAIQPSVKVIDGWGIGTALTPLSLPSSTGTGVTMIMDASGHPKYLTPPVVATTQYAATTVEQLEDSPVIAGQYFHEFPLAPEVNPKHYIDVVSDLPEDSSLRPALLAELSNLVREAGAAYASHHYNAYHFLLTLSDIAGGEGLEHGQSSDNGVGEKGYADDAHQLAESDLLPHEFTHSWNGKYRRPFNLYQDDFHKMQQGSLLWVYEGMTQYMGNVLAARAGLKTQAQYRDQLASSAASLDFKPGRQWRSTEDTAIAASILRGGNQSWANWKRGQDYYQEGELLWLDADTLIRKMTANKKSLTDFQRIFLGKGGDTGPLIVPYNREELIALLNQIVKYDWATFLHDRIDNINPRADLAGIEQGGYQLVYTDQPNAAERMAVGARGGGANVWYSIGIRLTADGTISDVRWNGPADKARLAPGMKIVAVNDTAYSGEALRAAIADAKSKPDPIRLITQIQSHVATAAIDYHQGERYPSLQRTEGTPAYLDEITKPLTTPPAAP